MTRPDLEALAKEWLSPILSESSCGDDEDDADLLASCVTLLNRVAARERARIAKAIRAKATEYVSVPIGPYHVAAALLRDLADDLENAK